MTSAVNGDIENVTIALTSGANVNVHHGYFMEVSILINSNKITITVISVYFLK